MIYNSKTPILKKGGKSKNWIQSAVNPKHEGFCTPMSKPTCVGKRRTFALTMKKHHGFHKKHENGGTIDFDISKILEKWKK